MPIHGGGVVVIKRKDQLFSRSSAHVTPDIANVVEVVARTRVHYDANMSNNCWRLTNVHSRTAQFLSQLSSGDKQHLCLLVAHCHVLTDAQHSSICWDCSSLFHGFEDDVGLGIIE